MSFRVELPGAEVLFSTRDGGFSEGAYASLNLGLLTGDDRETVIRNRRGMTDPAAHNSAKSHPRQVGATNKNNKMASFDAITGP